MFHSPTWKATLVFLPRTGEERGLRHLLAWDREVPLFPVSPASSFGAELAKIQSRQGNTALGERKSHHSCFVSAIILIGKTSQCPQKSLITNVTNASHGGLLLCVKRSCCAGEVLVWEFGLGSIPCSFTLAPGSQLCVPVRKGDVGGGCLL